MDRGLCTILGAVVVALAGVSSPAAAAAPLKVTWMPSFKAPGTPVKYDKVGVIKVGPASAKNVLVLVPGTSAAGAYFRSPSGSSPSSAGGRYGPRSAARACSRTSRC
jgi:hypothetical protein